MLYQYLLFKSVEYFSDIIEVVFYKYQKYMYSYFFYSLLLESMWGNSLGEGKLNSYSLGIIFRRLECMYTTGPPVRHTMCRMLLGVISKYL